jgi:phosphoribosylaminoimidazole-succinocarboxamide synthase
MSRMSFGQCSMRLADDKMSEIVVSGPPDIEGRSKRLWFLPGGKCYVELIPSLRSFTYDRDELIEDTAPLRLDFYERASARLLAAGIPTAFIRRVGKTSYVAEYYPAPPFEVIVKNRAVGSTLRKYPGLFQDNEPLRRPVVKFDYRVDPEDQPIGDDYLRVLDLPVDEFRRVALQINDEIGAWLDPVSVWDFCVIFGLGRTGEVVVISEISPDCMRLRAPDGSELDKDLFRRGASAEEITSAWRRLLNELA